MCVRTEFAEAPAVALQVTCSGASVVDSQLDAPVAAHMRELELPTADLLRWESSSSSAPAKHVVVTHVATDGSTTEVMKVTAAATTTASTVVGVDGLRSAEVTSDGNVRLALAGGRHHYRAAVVV